MMIGSAPEACLTAAIPTRTMAVRSASAASNILVIVLPCVVMTVVIACAANKGEGVLKDYVLGLFALPAARLLVYVLNAAR